MSRTVRVLWPVGVLLVSCLLMVGLVRWWFSTERPDECPRPASDSTSTPPPSPVQQGQTVTITGVVVPTAPSQLPKTSPLVPGLLVLNEGPQLCISLDPGLPAAAWKLIDGDGNQSNCLRVSAGQTLTVKAVHS